MEQLINCKKLGQDVINVELIPWTFRENQILYVIVVYMRSRIQSTDRIYSCEELRGTCRYRHFLLYNQKHVAFYCARRQEKSFSYQDRIKTVHYKRIKISNKSIIAVTFQLATGIISHLFRKVEFPIAQNGLYGAIFIIQSAIK